MARLAGINIPDNKHTEIDLYIRYWSNDKRLCETTGKSPSAKVQDLSEDQLDKLRSEIAKLNVEGDLGAKTSSI